MLCVIVGTAVSSTVTQDVPGSTAAAAAAAASTNDEDVVVVVADGSTRAPRLAADDDALLLAATAAACRLCREFDCVDCDAGDCSELAPHDEPMMLEIDRGRARCASSRWRVRIIDKFRRMMLPSGITLATLDGGAASETDELDCRVGRERGTRTLKWREDFIRHGRM
jgi:hypothetical protein